MKLIFFGLFLLCLSQPIFSQTISGTVSGQDGTRTVPIPFANVYWLNTLNGTMTDDNGRFELRQTPADGNRLVVSFVGYSNDTIEIRPGQNNIRIVLEQNIMLDEVQIVERQRGQFIDQLSAQRTDVITIVGLCQLACCNLAESFENSATVDVSFADAISGARQIQMLGLTGLHSQLMFENMPFFRGLSAPFGMLYVPGSYMESIQISKGTASVINGFEGLAGQINIEYRKPQTADPLFINLFYDSHHQLEANVIQNNRINDRFGITTFVHYSQFQQAKDHIGEDSARHHGDGFMDKPKSRQFNIATRLNYVDGMRTNITTLMFAFDDRIGGQMGFRPGVNEDTHWGFTNRVNRGQIFQKNGLRLSENSSIATQLGFTYMDLRAMYGLRRYDATERNFYANLIYENRFSEGHSLSAGASFQHNSVREILHTPPSLFEFPPGLTPSIPIAAISFRKTENIPGVFAQYTFGNDRLTLVGGLRYDYNTLYEHHMVTPRLHGRLSVSEHGTLRGSLGRAFRSPIPIAENMNLLASSRRFHIGEMGLEDAWNFGLNYHHIFAIDEERTISVALGAYRTVFRNQLLVNIDRNHQEAHFYMSSDRSFSNNAQLEIRTDILPNSNWILTLAGRYNDSRQTIDGQLRQRAFVAPWKFLMVNNLTNNLNTWQFDVTTQLHGSVRLPDNSHGLWAEHSRPFPIIHAQITRRFRNLDIYGGSENILNILQNNPIIRADNPFGQDFDASIIYGSLMERKFYIGIRWTPFGRN